MAARFSSIPLFLRSECLLFEVELSSARCDTSSQRRLCLMGAVSIDVMTSA